MKLGIGRLLPITFAITVAAASSGCAWWAKNGPVITADGANLASCIAVNYDALVAAEERGGLLALATSIARECNADSTQLVLDLFRSLKFANAQKAAKAKAAAPSSSCGN